VDDRLQAQAASRRLTTIEALRQFPGYFHLQTVLLRGEFAEDRSRVSLRAGDHEIGVLLNKVSTMTGPVEVRGQLIDVGRLEASDPRLAGYEGAKDSDRWPRPGEELLLSITGVTTSPPSPASSVRALALEPWRFEGQSVSVIGQFRGRNLFGDLPGAPAKSNYDFVLRAADGAVWVTGLRPRGKGFDLSVDARVDTNQWLQVTGVVRRDRGLVLIDAKTLIAAKPPAAASPAEEEPALPQVDLQPVEVVFSSPTEGDIDVPVSEPVRIQFSRGLNPGTLSGHIRIAYLTAPRTAEPTSPIETQSSYDAGTRAVQIKFVRPLDRFRTVRVEILDGIKAFDGADVKPWALMFTTGG
jgi:hypothetical protein